MTGVNAGKRINEDNRDYMKFTGPARLDRAVHTLQGLLSGIAADNSVSQDELSALAAWVTEHDEFRHRHPFNEIIPTLNAALADGSVDEEELADVVWLCSRLGEGTGYYDQVTADMQVLQGLLAGIASDGHVSMHELEQLGDWLTEHEQLRRCWPYDELESLLLAVRKDSQIDLNEHRLLLSFFSEFSSGSGHRALAMPLNETDVSITGLCAVCPEVVFTNSIFCFTGSSERMTRRQLAAVVANNGGIFYPTVRKDTTYLVIGADGNPCWAYACYGRKVEQAMQMRKAGSKVLLVHEHDFWDAVPAGH